MQINKDKNTEEIDSDTGNLTENNGLCFKSYWLESSSVMWIMMIIWAVQRKIVAHNELQTEVVIPVEILIS